MNGHYLETKFESDETLLIPMNVPSSPTVKRQKLSTTFEYVHLPDAEPYAPTNEDVLSMLNVVLQNQAKILQNQAEMQRTLDTRMANLEKVLLQNKIPKETKPMNKSIQQPVRRVTEKVDNDTLIEISATLPIGSLDVCKDVEKNLQSPDYEIAMKAYLLKAKGPSGTVKDVLRKMVTDDFAADYNVDGTCGKKSMLKLTLVGRTLFDIFEKKGRDEFEKGVRKFIQLSHGRHRQTKYCKKKISTSM